MIYTKLSIVDMLFKFTIVFHLLSYSTCGKCQSIFLLVSDEKRTHKPIKRIVYFSKPYDLQHFFCLKKALLLLGKIVM